MGSSVSIHRIKEIKTNLDKLRKITDTYVLQLEIIDESGHMTTISLFSKDKEALLIEV